MKIQTIEIRNVLALEHVTLDLQAPINLIVGVNESGKSSIRDALQVALTGQARGFKKHEDQAYLIREGAKAADIKITLADGQAISWHKTPKVAATRTGPVPDDAVMAAILSDPFHFLSLEDKARREVLFRLIPGLNPTDGQIGNRLLGYLHPEDKAGRCLVNVIPGEVEAMKNLAACAVTKGFAAAETEAITRRRIAKRVRDEAKMEEPEDRATIGGTEYILPDIKEEEVKDGIATLRAARDKLLQKRGKVEAQTDKLPEMESELEAMEENLSTPPTPGEVETLVKYLNINRPILEKLIAANEALESGTADQLWPEACPAFPGSGLACPRFGAVAIPGSPPPDTAKVEKLKADLNEQQEEVERLGAELKVAQDREKAFNEFQESYQKLSEKIAKLKEQQEQVTATAQLDQKIAVLDVRMKTGYELLDAVRDFWRKKEAADAAAFKLAEADKEVILYNALAKALAPDGIPSQFIAEALEPVNERLRFASSYLFPEFEDSPLVLTQDLEVYRSSPYACLSKSARYRAGIAFQVVLAQLAGARLLLIDEADILDPVNRAQLIDFLLAVRQDFDTILVFATSDHADPSPVPEIQVWWLEEGKVSPVRAREAA